MLGAIIGDVVGSRFEFNNCKSKNFKLITDESTFTDDTVLTIAVMDWLLHSEVRDSYSIVSYFRKWAYKYPNAGYGGGFVRWLYSDNPHPYNSKGNGCGMRVSPVAYVTRSYEELITLSDIVTGVTHNHPEGMKGARMVAIATWLAKRKALFSDIYDEIHKIYPNIEKLEYEDLVKNYRFNELAETTIPQALFCFLNSNDVEDCLRTTVSIGGDTDTLCAISMAPMVAFYGCPQYLRNEVIKKLPQDMIQIIEEFEHKYER